MVQHEQRGDLVKIISDSNSHQIPLGKVVTLMDRHTEHSDAWWVAEHPDVWVRTLDMEFLTVEDVVDFGGEG